MVNIEVLLSVSNKMSTQTDVDKLYQLYILLQEIMKEHVNIDEFLKEISKNVGSINEFETVANSAASISQTCEEIENLVVPKHCCSCS